MAILTAAEISTIVNGRGERVFLNTYNQAEKDIDKPVDVPVSDPLIPAELPYLGVNANAIGIMGKAIQAGTPTNSQIIKYDSTLDKWVFAAQSSVSTVITGHVGIGATAGIDTPISLSANDKFVLSIAETLGSFATTGNAGYYGQRMNLTLDSNTATTGAIFTSGIDLICTIANTNTSNITLATGVKAFLNRGASATGNFSGVSGIRGDVILNGAGTAGLSNIEAGIIGGRFYAQVSGTNTCTHLAGAFAQGWAEDTATITNVYGVYAKASNHNTAGPNVVKLSAVAADLDVPRHTDEAIGLHVFATNGAAATFSYGVKIDSLAGATNFGIWVDNPAWNNYFAGKVGIGVNPTALLEVNNAIVADASVTAEDTRFLLYDVTAATFKRVKRGAADSGGTGYRILRIDN